MIQLLASILYVAITGLISFYIGAALPRRWFRETQFLFKTFSWEKGGNIYNCINVRKWKSEITDMSKIMTNILPKKISLSATAKDVHSLILETCVAELIHWVLIIISFGHYWIWKRSIEGILMWFLCIIGNLPFIIVQRYNRPHLVALRNKMLKRKKYS